MAKKRNFDYNEILNSIVRINESAKHIQNDVLIIEEAMNVINTNEIVEDPDKLDFLQDCVSYFIEDTYKN